MKGLPLQRRTLALIAVIVPLLALFIYVGLRSGPLAPVAVTVANVESRAITPALFGIGTVEARYAWMFMWVIRSGQVRCLARWSPLIWMIAFDRRARHSSVQKRR